MATTTVMFTDIVGSTQHLQRSSDEIAVGHLTAHLRRCRDIVERSGGTLVKTLGDGLMATFASTLNAARAAIELQQLANWDARTGGPQFVLRIGLNVGETISDDLAADEVFGSAVVMAQRLCASAEPGEIRVSDLVRLLIGTREGLVFGPTAHIEAKGYAHPIACAVLEWSPLPDRSSKRVVVADDVALIRSAVARLLAEEGFEVVGEVGDFDAVVDVVRRTQPDLLVTDIRMPPTLTDEGLRAASLLRAERPALAVMVLSQHVDTGVAALLLAADQHGVGYLLKERVSELDEFVEACRTVADGGCVVDAIVTERLVERTHNDAALARLSEREREVLDLLAQGRSNAAIARTLFCSPKTLESHIRTIFQKLDLAEHPDEHRRVAAVVRWLHRDLP